MNKYDLLKLDYQLCFPLYACGKEITRMYKPFLDEIDLTYTQYITMMVVWEEKQTSLKNIVNRILLDSGTLTPLLKKLESKGLIIRKKDTTDDRNLLIEITEKGLKLREKAISIPEKISSCINLTQDEIKTLYSVTSKILDSIKNTH